MSAARQLRTDAFGLALLTAVFWSIVLLLRASPVSGLAWSILYLACAATAPLLWRLRGMARPQQWLFVALCAVWFAAVFCAIDFALDALNGARRAKADVASALGGLELWFVLCPGVAALALGGWMRHWRSGL